MNDREKIVAVGLLTERDLSILGQGFRRLYRLDDTTGFQHLLDAIDRAEREYQERHVVPAAPTMAASSGG
jgi:hypothetical protein